MSPKSLPASHTASAARGAGIRSTLRAAALAALMALVLVLAPFPGRAAEQQTPAPAPAKVHQEGKQAVQTRAAAQKKIAGLAAKEQEVLDKLEALEQQYKVLSRQRKRTEAYLADQEAKLAELRRRRQEYTRIRAELEPLLADTRARLGGVVESDLPFFAQERRERLAGLSHTLSDYDADLPTKTRRTLEALEIEARYGSTVSAKPAETEIEGKQLAVTMLRLGRLALFALAADGQHAWRHDPEGKWQPVHGHAHALNQAAEIAQRRRVVSLVQVPLGSLAQAQAKEGPATGPSPALEPGADTQPTPPHEAASPAAPASGEVRQ